MAVNQEMADIETTVQETLDPARRRERERKGNSQREVYRKALAEVQRIAGDAPMRKLSEWIQSEIRDSERLPSGRAVRKRGAKICRATGNEVSTGSWLGT